MFALVLISPTGGDLEATVTRLMGLLMQRGVREWWTIGGRYDGVVQGQVRAPRPLEERHLLTNNRCLVSRLPAGLPCRAVVTPDGAWHEGPVDDDTRETASFTPAERAAYRSQVEAWAHERAALLQTYHDCIAIGIDYGVWL